MSIITINIQEACVQAARALNKNINPSCLLSQQPESDLAKIVKTLGSPEMVKELLAALEKDFMKFLAEDCGISPTNYIMTLLNQDYKDPFEGFLYVADGPSKNLLEGLPIPKAVLLNKLLPVCSTSVLVLFFYKKLLESKIISGSLSKTFMLAYGLINKKIIEEKISTGKVFIEMNPVFMEHGMLSHLLQLALIAIAVNLKKINLSIELSVLLQQLINKRISVNSDSRTRNFNFWDYSLDSIKPDAFNTPFALNLFLLLFENEKYSIFRQFWIGNYIQSYRMGQQLIKTQKYRETFEFFALNITRSGVPKASDFYQSIDSIKSQYCFEHAATSDPFLFTLKRLPKPYDDIAVRIWKAYQS